MFSSALRQVSSLRSQRAFLAAIACSLVLSQFAAARADACADSLATSCAEAPLQVRRSYIDAKRDFELPTDDLPWISQALPADPAAPAPIAVTPTDAGVNARASLGQIRDYNAKLIAKKIEAAKTFAPKAAPNAAAPVAPPSPFDVWTTIDAQGLEGQADQSTRTGVGADYKLTKKTTIGVAAERGATESVIAPSADQKVSATLNYKAAPALSIDARTQFEETTIGGAATEKSSVTVAPRVGKTYALDAGKTIEPFVTYRQEVGAAASDLGAASQFTTTQSAGAGVTYVKPDAYSVSVTTDVENVGAKEPANLNSKLQLKLPIN